MNIAVASIGDMVYRNGKREPIISCRKINDDTIKFSTKTGNYLYRPLNEEERQFKISHPDYLIFEQNHTFCVIKDGREFVAGGISHIILNKALFEQIEGLA